MKIFTFIPPINLLEEGKWFLGVTSLAASNSVINTADEINGFSISILGH